jgi:RNA polymerase sigma factor (sigma-70 family)
MDEMGFTRVRHRTKTLVREEEPVRQLIAEAVGGGPTGERAWEILVERYSPVVWKVIRALGLYHEADRWDIYQATWLRALERLETVEKPESFSGWLAKVTLHQAYGFLRVRNRLVATDDPPFKDVLPDTLGEDLELDVLRRAIRAGLAMLAPEQQRLLHLLFSDPPLDYQTVAEILDKSTGYIGPTRRRSLEALARTKPVARLIEDERPSAGGDGHA